MQKLNFASNNGFAFVCEADCLYTVTDISAAMMDGENRPSTKLPQKQTDNTQTQLLEVKIEVYGDTKRINSYQFYSCL